MRKAARSADLAWWRCCVRCRVILRAAPQRSAIRRPAGVVRARFCPARCSSRHAAQHLNFTHVCVHHAVAFAGPRVAGCCVSVPPNAFTEAGAVMPSTIISITRTSAPSMAPSARLAVTSHTQSPRQTNSPTAIISHAAVLGSPALAFGAGAIRPRPNTTSQIGCASASQFQMRCRRGPAASLVRNVRPSARSSSLTHMMLHPRRQRRSSETSSSESFVSSSSPVHDTIVV